MVVMCPDGRRRDPRQSSWIRLGPGGGMTQRISPTRTILVEPGAIHRPQDRLEREQQTLK